MKETLLGCDLSSTETGWCLAKDGKILKYGTIKPSDKCTPIEKLIAVCEEVQKMIVKYDVNELVIEDIYCGYIQAFLILARLQGAIIHVWYKMKLRSPVIIRTTVARKAIGAPPTGKKKEVMEYVNKLLKKDFKNDNISDACVLVLAYYKLEEQNGREATGK